LANITEKLARIAENWQKSPKKLARIAENCDHNITINEPSRLLLPRSTRKNVIVALVNLA
jgi:hypothetical protein